MPEEMSDQQLRLMIMRLARVMRKTQPSAGITDSQLAVLLIVAEGPVSPSEIADRESVSPPAINRIVNALEARGLVLRAPDPGDARKIQVLPTRDGLDFVDRTRRMREEWFTRRLAELPAVERRALRRAGTAMQHMVTDASVWISKDDPAIS